MKYKNKCLTSTPMRKEDTLQLLKLENIMVISNLSLHVIRKGMKTGFVITAILVIVSTASLGIIHNAMAIETLYQAGHDHGCSDAKLTFSARYINQPGRGPQFHTQEFMSGYRAGFNACSSESSPVASNIGDNSASGSSSQFSQGFSNGVSDAQKDAKDNKLGSGPVVGVDCDSEVDSRFGNQNYCDGYTKGYMGEANKLTSK